jgi:hypothetical protein
MAKELENLRKGDCVRYQRADWFISGKDAYRESAEYEETQWTLTAKGRPEFYLILSEEKTDAGIERVWVLTQEISLSGVQCQTSPDVWKPLSLLKCDDSSPPEMIKLGQMVMNLDGTTSGPATDDEGQTVIKVTWDYYNDTRAKNVAIEIWKEPDRDYVEVYEGVVVQPSDFEVLSDEVRRAIIQKVRPMPKGAFGALWIVPAVGFFLFLAGLPFDYFLTVMIPVLAIIILLQAASAFWSLTSAFMWLALGGMLFLLHGVRASFWVIALGACGVSVLVPALITFLKPDFAEEDNILIFSANVLPPLWIYSFFMYFKFAPGPHRSYQLAAAFILPLAITAVAYMASRFFRYVPK